MSYAVKEMFLTLQGEGLQAGRRAVFIRFAGCNLWSGREQDRADAQCRFCDTDFVGVDGEGGGRFADGAALAAEARNFWDRGLTAPEARPFAVITGGEPTLQLDAEAIDALHAQGFEIAIETNGTNKVPTGVDWVCVSPKAGTTIVQTEGDELKLVWPQTGLDPATLESWDFRHRLVQPMDGTALGGRAPDGEVLGDTRQACIDFVLANPRWRLSVQTHKMIGVR
ncbi:7-carboxy-7-deazaguanine synthase [Sphingomonas sp. AP4-R1]|uniref:7-carboxy-7-deazaguanine synthase n=1 Tax=Sphingomonas sp. AP4-R1 TaxID=2735134 RepID=UPI001493D16E|nr:7-carboxy-7-deazaguanine synthase [Sphingomonas sp. AP4-R1]QJU56552.1 7-carboxy-7-deazaguanine synthase [Sphingomonas sp. AP4-R1]